MKLIKAAFLDRDGVINKDKAYVYRWSEFEFVPGAIEGMKKLQEEGYALVVITNQSGLARGYFTEEQYLSLNNALLQHLHEAGVKIDGVYHCPHHPRGCVESLSIECSCRKPKPGLLFKAADDLRIDLSKSIMIGDKQTDIDAGRSAGVGLVCSVSSDNEDSLVEISNQDGHFKNLSELANFVTSSAWKLSSD